jgi:L-fuculose-phosphate aldolase
VEEACVLALQFERAARMQLLAMAAGRIQPIPPALGREAHDWILTPKRSQVGFSYYARRALRGHPDVLS